MGWSFTSGAKRHEVIAERIRAWSNETHAGRTLRHCLKGNVLWTVREITDKQAETTERYIGCDLLVRERGYGFGYKDMCESMFPFYVTCPLAYLDMVPVACAQWREQVRAYHARQNRRLTIGATYALPKCNVPYVEIISLRPLRGRYDGCTYRVRKAQIGDEIAVGQEGAVA